MTESMRHWKQTLDAECLRALQAGASDGPPQGEQERVWAQLSAAVSVTGGLLVAGTAAKGSTVSALANGALANGAAAAAPAQALGHGMALVALKAVAIGFAVGTLAHVGVAVVEGVQARRSADHTSSAPGVNHVSPRRLSVGHPASETLAEEAESPQGSTERGVIETPRSRGPVSAAQPGAHAPSSGGTLEGSSPEAAADSQARAAADDDLLAESALLLRTRQALASAQPARALDLTYEHRRRFASGKLAQERDAIEVQALAQLGQVTLARARAEAFLRRYPDSPHRSKVVVVEKEPSQ